MARKKRKKDDDLFDIEDSKDSSLSIMNLRHETVDAISSILFIAVAVFMLLGAFNSAGFLGSKIFSGLTYLFGIGYYLIPLLLISLAISFLRNLKQNFALTKIIGACIFFISGLSMVHLLLPERGGVVGSLIASPIIRLVDVQATFLFLFAFLVISFLVMFDTPITFGFFKRMFAKKEPSETSFDETKEPLIVGNEVVEKPKLMTEMKPRSTETETSDTQEPKEQPKEKQEKEDKVVGESVFSIFSRNKQSIAFVPPPLNLLENDKGKPGVGDIKANANLIKRTLQNFGIPVEMDEITIGPTVTRYAMKPAEGVKLSRIMNLQDNLALALAAQTLRIEAPIPGKSLVGIEVPNTTKTIVGLGSMLSTKDFQESDKPLLVSIGKMVSGKPYYANVAKMPHLLIAGTTGSGKSVTVHAILTSLLYRNSPDMLKFIMVDAKRVELTLYNKIPHLLTPVITEAKKTIMALRWAAKEMDRRYDILEKRSVRDINSYHTNILAKDPEADLMPYIVIVIDELADLMQAYPRELEGAIVRLAQMSRAVGIHLILSTQRPSVNVITGLIKANIPTRIALKVGSQIDSRTIIDRAGAEKLVGQGDMLYVSQENPDPIRVQCPYISEDEVKEVVKYFVEKYKDEVPAHELNLDGKSDEQKNPLFEAMNSNGGDPEDDDELYEDARQLVVEAKKASTSYIQRKLRVGYARAARLMDMLEERGIIAAGDGSSKPREVLDTSGASSSEDETA
ncbi:MAG: cell division protein ftsK, segregation ATPase FtsK/SpoIIIE, family [Candidatus Parcubacteria bacterium]